MPSIIKKHCLSMTLGAYGTSRTYGTPGTFGTN